MKLKHLAALCMLLAIGCSQSSPAPSPSGDSNTTSAAAGDGAATDPATDTQLTASTVSYNVTGMR